MFCNYNDLLKIFTLFELSTFIYELNHSFIFKLLKPLLKYCILHLLIYNTHANLMPHIYSWMGQLIFSHFLDY
jgi:hypothetical protein